MHAKRKGSLRLNSTWHFIQLHASLCGPATVTRRRPHLGSTHAVALSAAVGRQQLRSPVSTARRKQDEDEEEQMTVCGPVAFASRT